MFPNKIEALEYIYEMRDYVHKHFKNSEDRKKFLNSDLNVGLALDTLGEHYASEKQRCIQELSE